MNPPRPFSVLLFKLGGLSALLLLAFPILAHAKIVRTVEKAFPVEPGGNLKITTQGGDIRVQTADIKEVRITARQNIQAGSEKEADERLEKLALSFEQKGNDVTAEARYTERSFGFHFRSWPPVQVDFIVTIPARFNADLHTSGGDLIVGSLTGTLRGRTSGGDIKLEKIDGDIDAATSGGDVVLREGTARARISTSGGDIHVDRAGGPTEVSTSGGDVEVDSATNLISATTSGGDVRAVLSGPLKNDCLLSTSGGEVSVRLDKTAGFLLDAHTSGGDVDASGLTITIDRGGVGRSRLVGQVNGGGPRLKLRSSGGDIVVRTN